MLACYVHHDGSLRYSSCYAIYTLRTHIFKLVATSNARARGCTMAVSYIHRSIDRHSCMFFFGYMHAHILEEHYSIAEDRGIAVLHNKLHENRS